MIIANLERGKGVCANMAHSLREVIFARRHFRDFAKFSEFWCQFAKISSREMSQGQSFAKINSREINSVIDRFAKIRFNEDDLVQNL